MRITPFENDLDRFFSKVSVTDGCWQWGAGRFADGYGGFGFQGKVIRAHRMAYEFLVGPIPPGLVLDHLCRNPLCVNPDHLEPVSQRINVLRGNAPTARNARKTSCPRGHEYSLENTRVQLLKNRTGRVCRACEPFYRASRNARKDVTN